MKSKHKGEKEQGEKALPRPLVSLHWSIFEAAFSFLWPHHRTSRQAEEG